MKRVTSRFSQLRGAEVSTSVSEFLWFSFKFHHDPNFTRPCAFFVYPNFPYIFAYTSNVDINVTFIISSQLLAKMQTSACFDYMLLVC